MDDSEASLDALPQELYDEIVNLTFTTDETSCTIDKTYKPPSSLQVSQSTRQQFAESYYGDGSIFYISLFRFSDFVNSVPIQHRFLFSDIRLFDAEVGLQTAEQMSATTRALIADRLVLDSLLNDIATAGLFNAVKTKVIYPDGTWKWAVFCQLMEGGFKF